MMQRDKRDMTHAYTISGHEPERRGDDDATTKLAKELHATNTEVKPESSGNHANQQSIHQQSARVGRSSDRERHIRSPAPSNKRTSNGKTLRNENDKPCAGGVAIPPCLGLPYPNIYKVLENASRNPPCTASTLKELELVTVQQNTSLRTDICYDDVHFQPITGKRGDTNRAEGEDYWLASVYEFRVFLHTRSVPCTACAQLPKRPLKTFSPRFPDLLIHLKAIVRLLVPETEYSQLDNYLNVELLAQHYQCGVLNMIGLAEWLASLLTLHCAPLRDQQALEMKELIREGAEQGDMQKLADGLATLFQLLERMKLDIINHQLRTLRRSLVDESIEYLQDHFCRLIQTNKFNKEDSNLWYKKKLENYRQRSSAFPQSKQSLAIKAFVGGVVALCDPHVKQIPATLQYDHQRFVKLQEDLQDLVEFRICLNVFDRGAYENKCESADSSKIHENLLYRLICLTEDESGQGGAISDSRDSVAMEIAHCITGLCDKARSPTTTVSQDVLNSVSRSLFRAFEAEATSGTQPVTGEYLRELETQTLTFFDDFLQMSPLEISDAQKDWNQRRRKSKAVGQVFLADLTDMARRLAHIAVMNWKIWAEICYLDEYTIAMAQCKDSSDQSCEIETDTECDGELYRSSSLMLNPGDLDTQKHLQEDQSSTNMDCGFSVLEQASRPKSVISLTQKENGDGVIDSMVDEKLDMGSGVTRG